MKDRPSYYWSLNDESGLVAVESVSGANGTISGGVTLNQTGAVGKSMLFNGTTGKVITTPVTITPTTSFEWWFKTTNGADITFWGIPLAASNDRILVNTNTATQITLQIYHASIAQVSTPTTQNIPGSLRDGNWHHLVLVFPGNKTMQLFLDGVSRTVDNLPLQQALVNQITEFQIGHHSNFVTWWNGNMDEVAIYNRALSANEIQSHYLAKFGITDPSSYAAKVILSGASNYWPLNDSSGTTAVDVIGNAAGTISGGVTLNQPGVTADSKSMTFDGATGKIVTAANVPLPSVCTVEGWIKATYNATPRPVFTLGSAQAPAFAIASSRLNVYDSANAIGVSSLATLANGLWYHAVWVFDGALVLFYINGVFDRSSAAVRAVAAPALVGVGHDPAFGPDPRGFWIGSLQDVAIYPRALSATEIAQHYSARLA